MIFIYIQHIARNGRAQTVVSSKCKSGSLNPNTASSSVAFKVTSTEYSQSRNKVSISLRRPKRYDADTFRGWGYFKIKVMSRAGYAALRINKR
ncbi:hypothetical protein B0T13DRAFT_475499 [Neurospora crassa]|nr:hypothetical protein B0T13DRAFT_475499 [Neurospora crassa]